MTTVLHSKVFEIEHWLVIKDCRDSLERDLMMSNVRGMKARWVHILLLLTVVLLLVLLLYLVTSCYQLRRLIHFSVLNSKGCGLDIVLDRSGLIKRVGYLMLGTNWRLGSRIPKLHRLRLICHIFLRCCRGSMGANSVIMVIGYHLFLSWWWIWTLYHILFIFLLTASSHPLYGR